MNPKSLRCSKRPSLRQLGTVPQLSQIRLLSAPVDNPLPCSVLPPLHMRRAVDVDLRVARERPQDWGPSGCDKANQNSHGLNMRNGTQVGKPVMDGFERLKGKPTYVGVLPRNKEMGSNTRKIQRIRSSSCLDPVPAARLRSTVQHSCLTKGYAFSPYCFAGVWHVLSKKDRPDTSVVVPPFDTTPSFWTCAFRSGYPKANHLLFFCRRKPTHPDVGCLNKGPFLDGCELKNQRNPGGVPQT